MARPKASEQERADQRNQLRRAADELHREGGLGAVSARAVAKRAGVSVGLLYSYFSDMSELMRSLWMIPIAKLGQSLAAVEANEPDPVQRIYRLLETYIDFTIEEDETHRGLLLWVRPPNMATERNDDPDDLMLFASLRRAVEAGQAQGRIRSGDAHVVAQLLWSGVHGALALPINIDTYDLAAGPDMATEMISTLIRSITIEETNDSA